MNPPKKLTLWQSLCGVFCNLREVVAKYPKIAMLVGQFILTGTVGSVAVVGYSKIPKSPAPVEESVLEILKEIKTDIKDQKTVQVKQGEQLTSLERGFRRQTKILSRYPGIKRVIQQVDEDEETERQLSGRTSTPDLVNPNWHPPGVTSR